MSTVRRIFNTLSFAKKVDATGAFSVAAVWSNTELSTHLTPFIEGVLRNESGVLEADRCRVGEGGNEGESEEVEKLHGDEIDMGSGTGLIGGKGNGGF